MVHMNGNGIGAKLVVESVKLFLKNSLRHDSAEAPHQMLEDGAFPPGQLHSRGADAHIATERIQVDVTGLQDRAECTAGTAKQGLGSGDEFGDGEGLDEI